jgi:hypothetical protein
MMRSKRLTLSALVIVALTPVIVLPHDVKFVTPPDRVPLYGLFEAEVHVKAPVTANPFTDARLTARFKTDAEEMVVDGYCDSADGTLFKVRFSPQKPSAIYSYRIAYSDAAGTQTYAGKVQCVGSNEFRPVVVDPQHPKHFIHAQSDRHFYHVGLTAYHLLDPSQDDAMIRKTIEYAVHNGFNKIRFLLAGYPSSMAPARTSRNTKAGLTTGPLRNYGAPDGTVNPLPVWVGEPHRYDFSRFNIAYWEKVERAIRTMRDRGIVATVIFTIEKQNLPKEYGALTEAEYRFYRYGIARLAAFSNVWFDLGNEHNEYRDVKWGKTMGEFVHRLDPYGRLISAHGYAEWLYPNAPWANWIVTQQYGTARQVNDWALKYWSEPKPYVNEEYGYEGNSAQPRHGQNADLVRRCHWAIALAGGYGTYGDQVEAASFYTGRPGKGRAPSQIHALRRFFEQLPYWEMSPHNELVSEGSFCYAKPGEVYVVYCPDGGTVALKTNEAKRLRERWFDPRTGEFIKTERLLSLNASKKEHLVECPGPEDWVLLLRDEGQ